MQVPSPSSTDLAIAPAVSNPERPSDGGFVRSMERLTSVQERDSASADRDAIHVVTAREDASEAPTTRGTAAPADTDHVTPVAEGKVDVAVARSTQGPLRGALHAAAVAMGHGLASAGARDTSTPTAAAAALMAGPQDTDIALDIDTGAIALLETDTSTGSASPALNVGTGLAGLLAVADLAGQAAPSEPGEGRTTSPDGRSPLAQPSLPVAATDAAITAALAATTGAPIVADPALGTVQLRATTVGSPLSESLRVIDEGTTVADEALTRITTAPGTSDTQPTADADASRQTVGSHAPIASSLGGSRTAVPADAGATAGFAGQQAAQAGSLLDGDVATEGHVQAPAAVMTETTGPLATTATTTAATATAPLPATAAAPTPAPTPTPTDATQHLHTAASIATGQAMAATQTSQTPAPDATTTSTGEAAVSTTPLTTPLAAPASTTAITSDQPSSALPTPAEVPFDSHLDAQADTVSDAALPLTAPDHAVSADEIVLRPVSQQAPLTTTASASTAFTPAQTSALAARVEAAVEALRHAPPPREAVLDVDGIRVTVRLVGEVVHVSSDQLGDGGRDLGQALANRGLQLGGGDAGDGGTDRDAQDQPQQSSRGTGSAGAAQADMTAEARTARDAGVLL